MLQRLILILHATQDTLDFLRGHGSGLRCWSLDAASPVSWSNSGRDRSRHQRPEVFAKKERLSYDYPIRRWTVDFGTLLITHIQLATTVRGGAPTKEPWSKPCAA